MTAVEAPGRLRRDAQRRLSEALPGAGLEPEPRVILGRAFHEDHRGRPFDQDLETTLNQRRPDSCASASPATRPTGSTTCTGDELPRSIEQTRREHHMAHNAVSLFGHERKPLTACQASRRSSTRFATTSP